MFPAAGLFTILSMDFPVPLPTTKSSNQHVIVLTDNYTIARVMHFASITSTGAATIFRHVWVFLYCVTAYLHTKNGLQFKLKFLVASPPVLALSI